MRARDGMLGRDVPKVAGILSLVLVSMLGGAEGEGERKGEIYGGRVGEVVYLRVGAFTEEAADEAGHWLGGAGCEGASALVLDVRVGMEDGDIRGAARWLDLFLPAGEEAFRIRGSGGRTAVVRSVNEPKWKGTLAVLADGETGNVGEILAWVLREKLGALVYGGATSGRSAFYSEGGGEGAGESRSEERVVADVLDGGGRELRGRRLEPDLAVEFGGEAKGVAYREMGEKGLEAAVVERVRPRRNEAALIAGTDPELPFLLEQTAREAGGEEEGVESEVEEDAGPRVDDPVLRMAMDTYAAAGALRLKDTVEHVRRRELRLEKTRRKLEELKAREAKGGGKEEVHGEPEK